MVGSKALVRMPNILRTTQNVISHFIVNARIMLQLAKFNFNGLILLSQ